MRVMLPFFSNFSFNTMFLFELGCRSTRNDGIEAWSTRGFGSAIENSYDRLILIIGRDILRNVINRIAKVELH